MAGMTTAPLRAAVTRAARRSADSLVGAAERLPVRDLLALREQHGGRSGEDLADALVHEAAKRTAALGAAGGLASAAPVTIVAAPARLVVETAAVALVELKLVAELHVVYGRAPLGTRAQVATAYLSAWASGRGVDVRAGALPAALGSAARKQLERQLARRLARALPTVAPFLAGAVAGAELNRRATRDLGASVRRDLRQR